MLNMKPFSVYLGYSERYTSSAVCSDKDFIQGVEKKGQINENTYWRKSSENSKEHGTIKAKIYKCQEISIDRTIT